MVQKGRAQILYGRGQNHRPRCSSRATTKSSEKKLSRKKKGRRNTKFCTILIFSDKFSSKITTKSQLSDMARMHAPRDPFSKGDDEGHDKPKYNCNLAKDESVSFTRFKFKELA